MDNFLAMANTKHKPYGWQVAEQIGGTFSGSLKFGGVTTCFGIPCCGCGCEKRPYTFSNDIKIGSTTESMSPTDLRPPRGEQWQSAKPGMETFLQEVDGLVWSEVKGWPIHDNHYQIKAKLENQGWLGRVQTYLKQHALFADLHPTFPPDSEADENGMCQNEEGQMVAANTGGLLLRIFTLDNAPSKNVQQPPSEDLPQQMNM